MLVTLLLFCSRDINSQNRQHLNKTMRAGCPANCVRCDSSGNCEECEKNMHVFMNSCWCDLGFYMDGSACAPCPDGYSSCQLQGTSDSVCTACQDHYYISGNQCLNCDKTCLTCYGPDKTQCKTCDSSKLMQSGQCKCPPGKYEDKYANCHPCTPPCVECSWEGNRLCKSCEDGYYLKIKTCTLCDPNCKTCNGPSSNECLSCEDGKKLVGTKCVCPDGQYLDGTTCKNCHSNCKTCSGPNINECTSCSTEKELSEDHTCNCRTGYLDSTNYQCKSCAPVCLTCYGSSSSSCYSCIDGYYLANQNSCQQCDVTCETCSGPGPQACTSCSAERTLESNPGRCLCQTGKYSDGAICKDCESPCTECEAAGNTKCSKCIDGYYVYNNQCLLISYAFTKSDFFSKSLIFSHSEDFSSSDFFSFSSSFSKSLSFSSSSPFILLPPKSKSKSNKLLMIGLIIAIESVIIAILSILIAWFRRFKQDTANDENSVEMDSTQNNIIGVTQIQDVDFSKSLNDGVFDDPFIFRAEEQVI